MSTTTRTIVLTNGDNNEPQEWLTVAHCLSTDSLRIIVADLDGDEHVFSLSDITYTDAQILEIFHLHLKSKRLGRLEGRDSIIQDVTDVLSRHARTSRSQRRWME